MFKCKKVSEGIIPVNTLQITQNGTYDVTNYASANVNITSEALAPYLGLYLNWDNLVELPYNSGSAYEYTTPSNGVYIISYLNKSSAMQHKIPGTNSWRNVLSNTEAQEAYSILAPINNYISAKQGDIFKFSLLEYSGTIVNAFIPFKDQTIKVLDWQNAIYFDSAQANYITPSDGAIIMATARQFTFEGVLQARQGCVYVSKGVTCNIAGYPAWFVPFESDIDK